jgi:hypothetical protein
MTARIFCFATFRAIGLRAPPIEFVAPRLLPGDRARSADGRVTGLILSLHPDGRAQLQLDHGRGVLVFPAASLIRTETDTLQEKTS